VRLGFWPPVRRKVQQDALSNRQTKYDPHLQSGACRAAATSTHVGTGTTRAGREMELVTVRLRICVAIRHVWMAPWF
jgi:hypothetical protein